MEKENQKIKCHVESCEFQNQDSEKCTLDEIEVNCNCDPDEATDKDETICNSFKNSEDSNKD